MDTAKTIFVTGATGKQGGAAIRHLPQHGFAIKAFTRNKEGQSAQLLRQTNVEIIEGNLDEPSTYADHLNNIHGIFAVLDFKQGPKKETEQGFDLITAAKEKGIAHFLYSSVIGADANTGIPHWESKNKIENLLKQSGVHHTIIRPCYFIQNRGVYPRPYQKKLPIWVAIGGTPESVVRAAQYGLPMALAIIGGMPARFASLTKLYRDSAVKAGHAADALQLGINSHVFIADTSQQAADEFYPSYADVMTRLGRERGWSPMNRQQYEIMRSNEGSLLVGSPQQVIDKILYEYELFGNTRFLAQMSVGSIPHSKMMHSIELLGTKVAPEVRKHLKQRTEATATVN